MADGELTPESIPRPPAQIIEAARRGKLAIFVGAGVSRLVGSPLWEGFANAALEQLCGQGVLNYSDIEQLRQGPANPKILASIAKDAAAAKGSAIDYRKILEPNPNPDLDVFKRLISIGRVFVTTNYDLWIERASEIQETKISTSQPGQAASSTSISRPPKFRSICLPTEITNDELLKDQQVIHLHGSIDQPSEMVISTLDYLRHYRRPNIQEFLEYLFDEFVVLFIGYGVEEAEVLEHVFRKQRPTDVALESGKHFWLFPAFSHQSKLLHQLAQYYRLNCNVELLPYRRDEQNYWQLAEVVRAWSTAIPTTPPGFIEKTQLIDRAFDE